MQSNPLSIKCLPVEFNGRREFTPKIVEFNGRRDISGNEFLQDEINTLQWLTAAHRSR